MKENKGNTILLTVIGIATLLIAVVGATFAYFSAVLSGNETDTTIRITSGTLATRFDGGEKIDIQGIYPRDAYWARKVFTITANVNSAGVDVPYYLSLVIYDNGFDAGALKYTLAGEKKNSDRDNGGLVPSTTGMVDIKKTGVEDLGEGFFKGSTNGEVTHSYTLEIFFPSEPGQNHMQGKTFEAWVDIKAEKNV